MNDTATREPAELRLLDVLLEEELRRHPGTAAQPPSAPRRSRVLAVAAVLLLGVGVVLGVLLGARGEQTARPANQQGGEREEVVPVSPAALAELLPKLESVVVTSLRSERPKADFPGLREWREEVVDPHARVSIADPVQLVQWMDALRAACGAEGTRAVRDVPPDCEVQLLLHGARQVRLQLTERGALQCGSDICLKVEGALLPLLSAGRKAADCRARLLRGRAMDVDELGSLPADLRELTVFGVDADDLAQMLPRFTQLEQLRCYPGGKGEAARASLPVLLAAIAPIRTLRTVRIPTWPLSPNAVAALSRLLQLEELVIEATGHRDDLPPHIKAQPTPDPMSIGLPALPNRPNTDLSALATALPAMPQLRVLRLLNCDGLHVAIQGVLGSRLGELDLEGSTIAIDDLRALAALGSLRTLHYDLCAHADADDADVVAALGQLRQLTRLEALCPAGRLLSSTQLRAALPQCAVTVTGYGETPKGLYYRAMTPGLLQPR